MNIESLVSISPVVRAAFDRGFTLNSFFSEGEIFFENNLQKGYALSEVIKEVKSCSESQTVVYCIQTAEGLKGIAFVGWSEHELD